MSEEADKIIRSTISAAIDDIWKTPPGYGILYGKRIYPNRGNLELLEEHTIYEIKALGLEKEEENKYIRKVIDALGPYSSDKPFKNEDGTFYGKFYFGEGKFC